LPRIVVLGAGGKHEREVEGAGHFDRRRDALDGVCALVDRAVGVVVLDRAAHGPGLGGAGDRVRGSFRRAAVTVLEVGRHREGSRGIERRDMGRNLVDRHAPVEATKREGEAGARRRERAKAERLEHARRAGVPRVGDDERLARMEGGERHRLLFLPTRGQHPTTLPRFEPRVLFCRELD
jgi:hypothetical protein